MKERESWEGHRDRLRTRAVSEGFDALRENQMIELLLCYAVPRADVSDVAKALIDRFGGDSQAFRERMIGLSGGAVCMIELGVALYMIRRGGVELKSVENERGER